MRCNVDSDNDAGCVSKAFEMRNSLSSVGLLLALNALSDPKNLLHCGVGLLEMALSEASE